MPNCRPCFHWICQMSVGSRHLHAHIFMKSMSWSRSCVKDYSSSFRTVCRRTGVAKKLLRCRAWRITTHGDETACSSAPTRAGSGTLTGEQPALYTNNHHTSSKPQSNRHRDKINNIAPSNKAYDWRSYIEKNWAGRCKHCNCLSSTTPTQTGFNTESTDGLGKVLYCRVSLAHSHRTSKVSMILLQLHTMINHNRKENLKTFPIRESSFDRPNYGRASLSLPNKRLSILTTKQWRAAQAIVRRGGLRVTHHSMRPRKLEPEGDPVKSVCIRKQLLAILIFKDLRRKKKHQEGS